MKWPSQIHQTQTIGHVQGLGLMVDGLGLLGYNYVSRVHGLNLTLLSGKTRCRVNLAHITRSWPDYGYAFHGKLLARKRSRRLELCKLLQARFRAKKEQFDRLCRTSSSEGHNLASNLALTVPCVPYSLDSGPEAAQ